MTNKKEDNTLQYIRLYKPDTIKTMFFYPSEYTKVLKDDELFQSRLAEFRKNLENKKFRDSLLQDKSRRAVQATEASTLFANSNLNPIETMVSNTNLPKPKKTAELLNSPTNKSSNKKKKRKKTKQTSSMVAPSSQTEIKTSQKAIPCHYNSLNDLQEMLSEIGSSQLPLNKIKEQYEQALIQLQKHKHLLTIQQHINWDNYVRQQLTLINTKPGLYYIQWANASEMPLNKNNLTTPEWSAVISSYEKGIASLIPANKKEHNSKKMALYRLISLYQCLEAFDKAIGYSTQLITSYPKEAKAYYQRAMSYALTNQFLPALDDVEQALAHKANFPLNEAINYEKAAGDLQQKLAKILSELEQETQQTTARFSL